MIDKDKLETMREMYSIKQTISGPDYEEVLDTLSKLLAVYEISEKVRKEWDEGSLDGDLYDQLKDALTACSDPEGAR